MGGNPPFFIVILWSGNFPLADETVDPMVQRLKSIDKTRENIIYTSYFIANPHRPEGILAPVYEKIIKAATIDLGLHHRSQYKIPFWMQVYDSHVESEHGYHDHFDVDTQLSWVHFVRPTKEKRFCFVDSNNKTTFPEEQKPGDFILFPSWAPHKVESNLGGEERVIIAGNVMFSALDLIEPNSNYMIKSCRRHNVEEVNNGQTLHLWQTNDYE